jgi:hypothetical protein
MYFEPEINHTPQLVADKSIGASGYHNMVVMLGSGKVGVVTLVAWTFLRQLAAFWIRLVWAGMDCVASWLWEDHCHATTETTVLQ